MLGACGSQARARGPADRGAGDAGHDAFGLRPGLPGERGGPLRAGAARLAGGLRPPGGAHAAPGAVRGGGQRASGPGGADGGALGPAGGAGGARGPRFDAPLPAGGYRWWYLDALSEDGRLGLVAIAFLGSVFSPYYAFARRRGAAPTERHCAVNLALYIPGRKYWAMTERGAAAIARDATTFQIGPSRIGWEGDVLVLEFAEWTVPRPGRLRGRVRLWPLALPGRVFALTADGAHRWWPIAPLARVEVELAAPALRFRGQGYLDANEGRGPLAEAFRGWDWSRAGRDREALILYEGRRRDGSELALALRATGDGRLEPIAPPPRLALPRSAWGLARATRADPGAGVRILRRLEDAPFYARALLATRLLGRDLAAIHETLSLERFTRPWVQLLLPFRMPRRSGWPPHRAELPEREDQDPAEYQDPLEQHEGAGAHAAIASLRAGSGHG